jgi:hypothetical protein
MRLEFSIGSPLTQKVTTDRITYQAGEPIRMTATETNTSDQAVTILNINDVFTVIGYDGVTLPAEAVSPGGPVVTLQPGQSQTFTATWDPGVIPGATGPYAYYTILFQDNFQGEMSPQFIIEPPPSPVTSPPAGDPGSPAGPPSSTTPSPVPTPPSTTQAPPDRVDSPVAATLTASRAAGRHGDALRIALILKNDTGQKVRLAPSSRMARITVLDGSRILTTETKELFRAKAATLKPGRSLQLSTVWSGASSQADLKTLDPGTYTVEVDAGGCIASTSIQLGGPPPTARPRT